MAMHSEPCSNIEQEKLPDQVNLCPRHFRYGHVWCLNSGYNYTNLNFSVDAGIN